MLPMFLRPRALSRCRAAQAPLAVRAGPARARAPDGAGGDAGQRGRLRLQVHALTRGRNQRAVHDGRADQRAGRDRGHIVDALHVCWRPVLRRQEQPCQQAHALTAPASTALRAGAAGARAARAPPKTPAAIAASVPVTYTGFGLRAPGRPSSSWPSWLATAPRSQPRRVRGASAAAGAQSHVHTVRPPRAEGGGTHGPAGGFGGWRPARSQRCRRGPSQAAAARGPPGRAAISRRP